MKRFWAIILGTAVLAGCRSSQPATNPFLRTTVPPPGTGQGMMVMPGEAATTPPVVTGGPPAVSPAVPVTPVPVQGAPVVAPPPKQEEFHPPGGSYLYHQSSKEPGKGSAPATERVTLAAARASQPSTASLRTAGQAGTNRVEQAAYQEPIAVAASDPQQESTLKFRPSAGRIRGDPPAAPTALTPGEGPGSGSVRIVGEAGAKSADAVASSTLTTGETPGSGSVRIVGETGAESADADASSTGAVLRVTAGEAVPAGTSGRDAAGGGVSRIAIVSP